MKLLFTGPLCDFSGFATASRMFAKTLNEIADLEVVARPLRYDSLDAGQKFKPTGWLYDMLQGTLEDIDVAIQMTTCNVEAVPIPGICNALYTARS